MDTRFWGKDGWKLLHSIVVKFPDNPTKKQQKIYKLFFNSLKYVLPCIYCRNSFTEYTNKLKIDNYMTNSKSLSYWLYLIHNMVNNKLRGQGYLNDCDPEFNEIYERYNNYVDQVNNNNCIDMPGWDFIYCIMFNYPTNMFLNNNKEHNNHKEHKHDKDIKDYTNDEKLKGYSLFLLSLRHILPFKISKILKKYDKELENALINRNNLQSLVYDMEHSVKDYINCKCLSYKDTCNKIEQHRAGCKKNTCRKNIK